MSDSLTRFFEKISKDNILTEAAALALYTAFSLAPLVILLLSFLSTLQLDLQTQIVDQVRFLMGSEAASLLEGIILKAEKRQDLSVAAGWFGAITLGVSASAIFGQLQSALNKIFGRPEGIDGDDSFFVQLRMFLVRRVVSFGMVLTFVFISIVSLIISSAMSMFMHQTGIMGEFLNFIFSLIIFGVLFAAIFKWMPDQRITKKAAVRGGLITAVLFVIGKFLIGIYVGQAAIGSAYGAAGSLIVLLVWVYYSSLIVFIGAEISSVLFRAQLAK